MRKTVSVPDDNILVADVLPGLNPGLDACATQRLVCVFSGWEELVVVIPGDPDRVLGEFRPPPMPGAGFG